MASADKAFRMALASFQAGKADDAERSFKELLRQEPRHIAGLNLLSILLSQVGRYEEAEHYVRLALNECATSDATFYNYGIILKATKRPTEALERFGQALAINAAVAETWNNRGTIFNDLGRYGEAIADFDKAISLNSNYADAFCNKGKSLGELNLYDQSLAAYDRALTLKPDLAEAWVGRGNVFTELKQYDDAFAAYDRALTGNPDLAEAWLGRGKIFAELKQYSDAFAAYDRALTLRPDLIEAWLGRGTIFTELRQYNDAFAAYDRAFTIKHDSKYVEGERLRAKLTICDWPDLEAQVSRLLVATRNGIPTQPFTILFIPSSPADQLACAKCYISDRIPISYPALWRGERYLHDRIRIGYVSADFHDHATAYLMAGLFEEHLRSRFEIIAISIGPDEDSDARTRLKSSFDRFIDAHHLNDRQTAELIHELQIDIAVDLKGFTQNARTTAFAYRPAPIQVNYLGYPGTMGIEYFDYILADQTVIPEDEFKFYTEQVVWLPDSYQVNDAQRRISEHTPTRGQCSLPETGFIFCCFNNTFKITPDGFDIWMRLLHAVQGSVLWLLEANSTAPTNLRREAESRGVSSERLIFAPRMMLADHLARHRVADLFLDTLPYNAHTTASDALWAGLPVLTCLGSTFAGRVAGSLLKAVGLPELIATSLEQYEGLALSIARDPNLLALLKAKLLRNRDTYPLFDTRRFTRHIETAYTIMWERYQRGEPPMRFAVGQSGDPLGII
jgi:predicted O-linked N-acetylglucosamine transferase (SPINDLY family)